MTRPTLGRLRRVVVAGAIAGAMSGCYFTSRQPKDVIMASAHGQIARVRLPSTVAIGELLALSDTSLFLLRDDRVAYVPLRGVAGIEFGPITSYDVVDGAVSSKDREEVQRRSRFPYGLTPEALTNLLRASGQTQPDLVSPPAP